MAEKLPDTLDAKDIVAAIEQINEHGDKVFAESTRYDLIYEGDRYPPKRVVGVAAKIVTGNAYSTSDFSGGVGSKCFRLLLEAGFTLEPKTGVPPFDESHTYSRADVGERLLTEEITTKGDWGTGYHLHRLSDGTGFWFIFANEGDEEARTGHNYSNVWKNLTTFAWEARTGAKLTHKQVASLISGQYPVLLFSRKGQRDKFTYHGVVTPSNIQDTVPAKIDWILGKAVKPLLQSKEAKEYSEDEAELETDDQRQVAIKAIKLRRGQPKFRKELLEAHPKGCQISGCNVVSVLEAAHIKPYRGEADNHISNGLLLRADLHTLFDLHLLKIEPATLRIVIDKSLRESDYWESFNDSRLRCDGVKPHEEAISEQWTD